MFMVVYREILFTAYKMIKKYKFYNVNIFHITVYMTLLVISLLRSGQYQMYNNDIKLEIVYL